MKFGVYKILLIFGFVLVLCSQIYILIRPSPRFLSPAIVKASFLDSEENLLNTKGLPFIDRNPKSVYMRLVKGDCKDCNDRLFSAAKQLAERSGKESFVVLAANFPDSDFFMYKRLYRYSLVNFFQYNDAITKLDSVKRSYYFLVNKKQKARATFIFFPENGEKIEQNRYEQFINNIF